MTLGATQADFPQGGSYANALLDAAAAWTNSRSKVVLGIAWGDNTPGAPDNEESEVYWVDNLEAPAMTIIWTGPPTCVIQEVDVIFLDTINYSASDDPNDLNAYEGPSFSFPAVAMHEFGHVQGIQHRHDVYNIMGDANTHLHLNNGVITAYPGEWGITRSVEIYGQNNGTYEDVGAAHWERTGAYGGYSLHGRTSLSTVTGPGVVMIEGGDVLYEVEIGQKVKVEVTLENFGKNSQNVRVGYYLSTNDNLSTQDTFLGSHMKVIGPNTPTTIMSPDLTIPASLDDETNYWIGAIVDDNQQLAELNEWNNRTSIRIQTRELQKNIAAIAIAGSAKVKAGTSSFVSSVIENVGGGVIAGFTYEIRLSKNTTITNADPLVATFESATLGFKLDQVTVPANLPSGDYYWGLRILPVSGESTTNDNRVAGGKVKITKGAPDLVAYGVAGPPAIEVGDEYTFQCAITNEGGLSMGPYYYRLYLSQDSQIEPTDILLKSGVTFELGTKVMKVKIPALPAVGNYRLGLIVDPTFNETDLSDNTLLGNYVIVTSIDGTPDDVTGS
jgi:hypothetical protein